MQTPITTKIQQITGEGKECTIFDALRDNKGSGLRASDLLTLLKKIKIRQSSRHSRDRKLTMSLLGVIIGACPRT